MHTWKPDAYGEAPGVVGAAAGRRHDQLRLPRASCASVADHRGGGRGRLRPAGCWCSSGSSRWRSPAPVHGRPARLQAHARLLERRAHGHPRARRPASAAGAGFGDPPAPASTTPSPRASLFLSAGNIHRAFGSKTTDEVRGALTPAAGLRHALPGRLPRHHRLAPVRPVRQRVRDPQVDLRRASAGCSAASSSAASSWSSSAWARRSSRRSRARPPAAARATDYRDRFLTVAPAVVLLGLVLLFGLHLPAGAARAARRRRRRARGGADERAGGAGARSRRAPPCPAPSCPSSRRTSSPTPSSSRSARGGGWSPTSACRTADGRPRSIVVLADDARAELAAATARVDGASFPSRRRGLPAGPPVRARDRRAVRARRGGAPVARSRCASQWASAPTARRRRAHANLLPGVTDFFRVEGDEVHEVGGRPGPRRRHRAGPLPLPVPRRGGVPPRDLASATSTAASSARSSAAPTARSIHYAETAGRRHHASATPPPTARSSRRSPGCRVPARGAGAARHRARARAAGQPRRRPRRAGRRRRLPADRLLLRPHPRRLPQPDRAALRQPLRPRPGAARRRRLRPRRRRAPTRSARAPRRAPARRRRRPSSCSGTRRRCMARFEDTGVGAARGRRASSAWSGPAARACGLERDVRHDYPARHLPLRATSRSRPGRAGDVFARAYVRWLEIQRSVGFVREQLDALPGGPGRGAGRARSAPGRLAVALVEGWRGEICHVALTDDARPLRALQGRRPVVPQLVRAWRWRCAASRSPTSRSATRASTSPTAGTTCDRGTRTCSTCCAHGSRQGHRTHRLPGGPAPALPDRFRGRPVIDAARCAGGLPGLRRGLPDRRRSGREPAARHRPRPLPVLRRLRERLPDTARIASRGDHRLAARARARTWWSTEREPSRLAGALDDEDCAGCSAARSSCAR